MCWNNGTQCVCYAPKEDSQEWEAKQRPLTVHFGLSDDAYVRSSQSFEMQEGDQALAAESRLKIARELDYPTAERLAAVRGNLCEQCVPEVAADTGATTLADPAAVTGKEPTGETTGPSGINPADLHALATFLNHEVDSTGTSPFERVFGQPEWKTFARYKQSCQQQTSSSLFK